jgi:hypothetical protein
VHQSREHARGLADLARCLRRPAQFIVQRFMLLLQGGGNDEMYDDSSVHSSVRVACWRLRSLGR